MGEERFHSYIHRQRLLSASRSFGIYKYYLYEVVSSSPPSTPYWSSLCVDEEGARGWKTQRGDIATAS